MSLCARVPLVAAALLFLVAFTSHGVASTALKVGDAAPDIKARSTEGERLRLSELRGKYILVDFWATWCGPCLNEVPYLKKVQDTYVSDTFGVIGISADRDKGELRRFTKEHDLTYPQILDENGEIAEAYGVTTIPRNFLIDPEGKIIAMDLRGEALPAAIAKVARPRDAKPLPALTKPVYALIKQRRFAEAIRTAQQLVQTHPEDAAAPFALGDACAAANNPAQAVKAYADAGTKAVAAGDADLAARAYIAQVMLYQRSGSAQDALAVLEQAVQKVTEPKYALHLYYTLARLAVNLQRWDEAKSALDEFAALYEKAEPAIQTQYAQQNLLAQNARRVVEQKLSGVR